jgi:hypothetical protein
MIRYWVNSVTTLSHRLLTWWFDWVSRKIWFLSINKLIKFVMMITNVFIWRFDEAILLFSKIETTLDTINYVNHKWRLRTYEWPREQWRVHSRVLWIIMIKWFIIYLELSYLNVNKDSREYVLFVHLYLNFKIRELINL